MIARAPSLNPWRAGSFLVPSVTILIALLMMPLPLAIKLGGYWIMPSLPILAIFLWTMFRPDLLSPFAVLAAGVLADLLIHGPVGISSLAYLVVYAIVISQRLYWMTLPGPFVLVGFAIVMIAAECITWLAVSFVHGQLVSPVPALLDGIVSVAVFPLARWAFAPLLRLTGPAV